MIEDLGSFLRALESAGELARVAAPVSARYEISEIVSRVTAREGPAILFENVEGYTFPVAANLLASPRRIEIALGRRPEEIGAELVAAAHRLQPPSWRGMWESRDVLRRAGRAHPRRVSGGACQQVVEEPDLSRLPILTSWPHDGGPFVTWPMVLTRHPVTGGRNLGTYRMHVFDERTTGMHMQIQKGGGFHYHVAESRGESLPVCVVLGGDPVLMLASVAPLPEDIDELAFASYLRGRPLPVTRAVSVPLEVPASADFILEGEVPPRERRMEGPFGDHFGHYSHPMPHPVFRVRKVTRRRDAVFPVSVVGQPPQEDRYIGDALQEMMVPLARLMHPEIRDVWAFYEAGFHNLLSVAVSERYEKEAFKAAFGMLGTGQVSLSKVVVAVGPHVQARDPEAVLREIGAHFDPAEDFLLLPGTAMDTLDFTSYTPNLGSKMILDATPSARRPPNAPLEPGEIPDLRGVHRAITGQRLLAGSLLAVQVRSAESDQASGREGAPAVHGDRRAEAHETGGRGAAEHGAPGREAGERGHEGRGIGREVLERLLSAEVAAAWRILARVPIIAVVSEDVRLEDRMHLLWGLFCRFDAARDVIFCESKLVGAAPVHRGTMGIDATWKPGYPRAVRASEETRRLVDRRWGEYSLGTPQ